MPREEEKSTISAGPLFDLLEERGVRKAEFASSIHVSPQMLSNWRVRGIPGGQLYTVTKALGLSVERYMQLANEGRKPKVAAGKNVRRDLAGPTAVPMFDVEGSMGPGRIVQANEAVIGGLNLSREWVRSQLPSITSFSNLAVISAFGDSMAPTFNDGDILLVDRGVSELKLDAVYVLGRGEDLFIKRVQRRFAGELMIRSDNPLFEPEVISGNDIARVRILGRVVWAWNGKRL